MEKEAPLAPKFTMREALLGRLYLAASLVILLAIVFWQSERFQVFGSAFMLGWDNPNYIRLANALTGGGFVPTVTTWAYPQLYVQILAGLGSVLRNVVLADRVLPLAFGLLSICGVFLLVRDISASVHVAGLASILQASSISFLKLVSGNDRNLMAFSLTIFAMLLVQRMWRRGAGLRGYVPLIAVCAIIAYTSFETLLIFSIALIVAGIITKKPRNVFGSLCATAIPTLILLIALPSYFLTYVQTVQTPIQTPKQVVGAPDLYYWTGGSVGLAALVIAGLAYVFLMWRKRGDILSLLVFVWTVILLSIFVAANLRLAGLQAEFGVRALLLIPSYVLIPLAVLAFWTIVSQVFQETKLHLGRLNLGSQARLVTAILVIGIVLTSTAFGLSESGTYFSPYVSPITYNKIVLTSNLLAGKNVGVPIVVFYGSSGYDSLYRGYIGALMGEHFAYYGGIGNLLRLKPSLSNSTDGYTANLENILSATYFDELTGNVSGPTEFGHSNYITTAAALMSHPLILITPELYDGALPGYFTTFYAGDGIYIVPPNGISNAQPIKTTSDVTIYRDGTVAYLNGQYYAIDPFDPSHRSLIVNASSGFENYNITSFPSNWKFIGIEQGGNPSRLDFNPMRPDGSPAVVGNDYADSITGWAAIPDSVVVQSDTVSKMEGRASLSAQGTGDAYGNVGLKLSLGSVDLSTYNALLVWAKCNSCSSLSLSLVDATGNSRLIYPDISQGPPTAQFKRFSFELFGSTGTNDPFDIHTVGFISFLAYSSIRSPITLWIDDLVVQHDVLNPAFLDKQRVIATDQVDFFFIETAQESDAPLSVLPLTFYSPVTDEVALTLTTSAFIGAIVVSWFVSIQRRVRSRPQPVEPEGQASDQEKS